MTTNKQASRRLFLIKAIHTLIWLVLGSAVLYVLWSGLSGNINRWSWICVLAIIVEGGILLLFRGSCPLTVVARKYSSSTKANFDIFLPELLAKYNQLLFGTLFTLGLLLMLLRLMVR